MEDYSWDQGMKGQDEWISVYFLPSLSVVLTVLYTEKGFLWLRAGSRKHTGKVPLSAARQTPAAGLSLYDKAVLGHQHSVTSCPTLWGRIAHS